jgi:hypothetical protein
MSVAAYKSNIRETENPRDIERRILLRLVGEMDRHATEYDASRDKSERVAILAGGLRETLAENIKVLVGVEARSGRTRQSTGSRPARRADLAGALG